MAKIRSLLDAAKTSVDQAHAMLAELEPDLAQLTKFKELAASLAK